MKKHPLIVIPICQSAGNFRQSLPLLEDLCCREGDDAYDLLVIDDGSSVQLGDLLEENRWIQCIAHEESLGFGGVMISALKYARDLEYDVMMLLDPRIGEFYRDITPMMDNISYGYDIVTCSRILENYDHSSFPARYTEITLDIADALKEITDENLTDPLSGIKAFQVKALECLDLSEFGHGALLQLWVQSAFYGLAVIEIPAQSGESFGTELELEEDPLGAYLSLLEAERLLYPKKSIN
jgi:glycosyltransferase involved in cell wall biosynthesis